MVDTLYDQYDNHFITETSDGQPTNYQQVYMYSSILFPLRNELQEFLQSAGIFPPEHITLGHPLTLLRNGDKSIFPLMTIMSNELSTLQPGQGLNLPLDYEEYPHDYVKVLIDEFNEILAVNSKRSLIVFEIGDREKAFSLSEPTMGIKIHLPYEEFITITMLTFRQDEVELLYDKVMSLLLMFHHDYNTYNQRLDISGTRNQVFEYEDKGTPVFGNTVKFKWFNSYQMVRFYQALE
jgi:hypothetical protein